MKNTNYKRIKMNKFNIVKKTLKIKILKIKILKKIKKKLLIHIVEFHLY